MVFKDKKIQFFFNIHHKIFKYFIVDNFKKI